jgi:radical SAM superfamily enzyme YgiQ (UPF0313 family)
LSRLLKEKALTFLDSEKGTVYKDPGGRITLCLVYPNTYHIGMSALGFQAVYGLFNKRYDVVCERCFLPDREDIKEFERTHSELFSLESQRPLKRFDILAFSVSFENDYPHIVKILNLARIPLRSKDRDERFPLIIMGGICASFNPEPLAEFFDIIFIGEAEAMINDFIDGYKKSVSREKFLYLCHETEGLYVPSHFDINPTTKTLKSTKGAPQIIKRQWINNISLSGLKSTIITPYTEFSNMYLIEAQRGCPRMCRFCVASYCCKPSRTKDREVLKREIEEAKIHSSKIGLVGPSLSDIHGIDEALKIEGVEFSLTSLRASAQSVELAQLLDGKKSISLAPESGSERLTGVINKKISLTDVRESTSLLLEFIDIVRLYFIIGLPTEEPNDIEQILILINSIREKQKKGTITLCVSPFIPKPGTPFQWMPMDDNVNLHKKIDRLQKGIRTLKGVQLHYEQPALSALQTLFARGGRRTSDIIEAIGSGSQKARKIIKNLKSHITSSLPFENPLPWDFIDTGMSKDLLLKQCKEALNQALRIKKM